MAALEILLGFWEFQKRFCRTWGPPFQYELSNFPWEVSRKPRDPALWYWLLNSTDETVLPLSQRYAPLPNAIYPMFADKKAQQNQLQLTNGSGKIHSVILYSVVDAFPNLASPDVIMSADADKLLMSSPPRYKNSAHAEFQSLPS